MNEMVERVARAMFPGAWSDKHYPEGQRQWRRAKSIKKARAAIAAMRKPTGDMGDAGAASFYRAEGDNFTVTMEGQPTKVWQAMIDCALSTKDGGKL